MVEVIAEIGCNHRGSLDVAKEMISVAADYCHADVAKFQKRTVRELLSKFEYERPHPVPYHAYGDTYGKHREALEFSIAQHRELKSYCESLSIEYSTSVWDITAAKEVVSLKPEKIKIPSACNLKFEMLRYLCDHYYGKIHLSLGMTTKAEEESIIDLFIAKERSKDLILYHCTSGYPISFDEVCLLEIQRLKNDYQDIIDSFGFSGHHLGVAIDIGAIMLGIKVLERHFTLDRTWPGSDQAASLEPDGLRKLIRDRDAILKTLKTKDGLILPIEEVQRKKFGK